MAKKIVRVTAITLAVLLGLIILIVVGYVIYVAAQYYRIEDNAALEVNGTAQTQIETGKDYSVVSYNLGFGAYSPEYSFFMDTGEMNDGAKTCGIYAKGMSKEDVDKNVKGQIETLKSLSADFCFLQEVDERADRSYHINMREEISGGLSGYASTYAYNFHTANLLYPFNDPIGKSDSGILTLSRYKVDGAVRRSFPVTDNFIDKLFDLDRCFSVQRLPVGGSDKTLVMINLHMSAYDQGGKIRAKQLEMLNGVLSAEYAAGNYVVAGGDFNHCLIADGFESDEEALSFYESKQKVPEWVKGSILHGAELADGFEIKASAAGAATCRGADMPYEKGVNYETVIDGFIVSDNIEVTEEGTVDIAYAYSDHNPVKMTFKLK